MMENIHFLHLGCHLNDNGQDKGTVYFILCKKTKKVALIDAKFGELAPYLLQDTQISNDTCLDGEYCLNIDCKYCTSPNFENSVAKSGFNFLYKDNPQGTVNFLKDNIDWIHDNIRDSELGETDATTVISDFMQLFSKGGEA